MHRLLKKHLTLLKSGLLNRDLIRQIVISEKNLMLSKDELLALRWCKLKSLLQFAFSNCPFYRQKYIRAGIEPNDIRNIDDFRAVPIITKDEIRQNLREIIARNSERSHLEEVYTSGTTGVPLKIYRDTRKKNLMHALYRRTVGYWGCDIGCKKVWIWGLPREIERVWDYRYQSRARRFLKNEAWFNAFDVTKDNMLSFTFFLNRFRPHLIISHVSVLCEYARFLKEEMIVVNSPRAIWITAEPSHSAQRELIENVFGARTYDEYGSSEIRHVAAECSYRSGMHINADSRYVEILDSNNQPVHFGEGGNIVLTDLENRVMPLIRYKNGDVGSLLRDQCKCGLNLPLMGSVRGRIFDIIVLKNGRKIYGQIFARILFEQVDCVRQFQVHQISLGRIVIRIVPEKNGSIEGLKLRILSKFRLYTGSLIRYTFEIVPQIKREKSGKFRFVKSDVGCPDNFI